MNKSIILFLVITALLGSCGENRNSSTGGNVCTCNVKRYTVAYSKSSDYIITGLNEDGYLEGETVEFRVDVMNVFKEIDLVSTSNTPDFGLKPHNIVLN